MIAGPIVWVEIIQKIIIKKKKSKNKQTKNPEKIDRTKIQDKKEKYIIKKPQKHMEIEVIAES